MTDSSSVPLHIISGFLGSGKTTFLKEILSQLPGNRKTGVIQNEFAPVSIDGAELRSTGAAFDLLEINNGSVFCVCLLSDFVTSMDRFLEQYAPDLLILEASGLADTTSIAEVLSHPLLSGRLFLSSNWCIVDAANFLRIGKMQQRVIHQVRMADRILINKSDLAPELIPEISERVRSLNPFARVQTTTFCRMDFQADLSPVTRFMPITGQPLPRPDIATLVIKTTRKMAESRLSDFLEQWAPLSYRIKGFVQVSGGKTVAVHTTPGQTEIRPADYWSAPTELMAITDRYTLREWNHSFREFAE